MAVKALGTNANNSLVAVAYSLDTTVLLPADLATVNADIKNDLNGQAVPGAFVREGFLFLPRRQATIMLLPGDVIAVDTTTGWPILVSAAAIASGPWHFA